MCVVQVMAPPEAEVRVDWTLAGDEKVLPTSRPAMTVHTLR